MNSNHFLVIAVRGVAAAMWLISSSCITSNGVDNKMQVLEMLWSTDVPAIEIQGMLLHDVVEYINSAASESYRAKTTKGGRLIFQCPDHMRERRLKPRPAGNDRPIGAGHTRVLSLRDIVREVCASAHVHYVIRGNRVVFVDDESQ